MNNLRNVPAAALRDAINASQWEPTSPRGLYESYFLRANHPTRPLAFWIRYTLFSPRGNPAGTEGQLWAIWFDGEAAPPAIAAVKQPVPLTDCAFSRSALQVRMGASTLDEHGLRGAVHSPAHRLAWRLAYQGSAPPAFLLPLGLYHRGLPKAKVLTGIPLADFSGTVEVDGRGVDVTGWRGSQNHNWGLKHTDRYAWGQVAGFDGEPDAFLECSTARLKLGPLWTPWLTSLVLRLPGQDGEEAGEEIRLNALPQAVLRNRGRYRYFEWQLACRRGPLQVDVNFSAPAGRFVALGYDDPPGGRKTCLNTKLATCTLRVTRPGRPPRVLHTDSRAAFEILTMGDDHGLPLSA